ASKIASWPTGKAFTGLLVIVGPTLHDLCRFRREEDGAHTASHLHTRSPLDVVRVLRCWPRGWVQQGRGVTGQEHAPRPGERRSGGSGGDAGRDRGRVSARCATLADVRSFSVLGAPRSRLPAGNQRGRSGGLAFRSPYRQR